MLDVDYKYYSNGWLKSVLLNGSSVAMYTYDQAANRERVDLGNTTYTTYEYDTYDARYLLSEIDHIKEGTPDTSFAQIGYARDAVGNPTTIGGQGYTYDANNRLDSWVSNADYNYDWVGNRLTPGDMEYNEADQLTDWPGQHKYTYLATGSLAEQWNAAGTEVEKEYTYTYRNLLSTVTHYDEPNDPVSSMGWDAEDNRVSFTSSTVGTTYFVYDPTAGDPAVIEEATPGGSAFYVREPNGALIARVDGETIQYYHLDQLGSTRLRTSTSGTLTDQYSYDAWGNITTQSGSTQQPYRYVGQLGYYAHYQDARLSLVHLGVRLYDPATGRFTQVDPLGEGLSPYPYALNEPTRSTDPSGLATYICYHPMNVKKREIGHTWVCHDGQCRGCYIGWSWRGGRVQDDTPRMDDAAIGDTADDRDVCFPVHGDGDFESCVGRKLPKEGDACWYSITLAKQCTTFAFDLLSGCNACGVSYGLTGWWFTPPDATPLFFGPKKCCKHTK